MNRPHRVLHYLSGMNRGGIETWLMNVFRRLDRDRVVFDFYVEARERAAYDDEIEQLGGRVFHGPAFTNHPASLSKLAQVIRREGPFDVFHAHGRPMIGLPITVARLAGVPVRLAHGHSSRDPDPPDLKRRIFRRIVTEAMVHNATSILGCAAAACEGLVPGRLGSDPNVQVLAYGVDTARFRFAADARRALGDELGLPADARILGHVGRFVPVKNHAFLVPLLGALVARDPRWHLVLVGDGALRPDITAKFEAAGLSGNVRFAGLRGDVERCMSAMDVLVLPSFSEGSPMVLVEGQAVGLPAVVSTKVPGGAEVIPGMVRPLDLEAPIERWADVVIELAAVARDRGAANQVVAAGDRAIDTCVSTLLHRYYRFADA